MCNADLSSEVRDELHKSGILEEGKPIIITVDGREHNIVVTHIGNHYLFGYVASNRFVVLYSENNDPRLKAQILDQEVARNIHGNGNKVILDVACVVGYPHLKMSAPIKGISLFEFPWRPFIPNDAIDEDGNIVKPEAVINSVKKLGDYYIGDGQFVESPGAWPKGKVLPFMKVSNHDDDESSEEPLPEKRT